MNLVLRIWWEISLFISIVSNLDALLKYCFYKNVCIPKQGRGIFNVKYYSMTHLILVLE